MTRRVVLHIGAMKTGTTYVQQVLFEHRDVLHERGVLVPGRRWSDQVHAVQDLLDMPDDDPAVTGRRGGSGLAGSWDGLVSEVVASEDEVAVVSMEFLSFATLPYAERAVAAFGDAEVRVVLTVRDAAAVAPAQWQTAVVSGGTDDWPTFQRGVRRATGVVGKVLNRLQHDEARETFLRAQLVPRILETWAGAAGVGALRVVTMPPPGSPRGLLWERFCRAAGIDGRNCERADRANESLGYASTELLRRVNLALDLSSQTEHNKTVKDHLAQRALASRSGEERARLDPDTAAAAMGFNEVTRAAVATAGLEVVGDLGDLPVHAEDATAPIDPRQEPPGPEELLAAARTAYPVMVALCRRRAGRIADRGGRPRLKRRLQALGGPDSWTPDGDGVDRAVDELAALCEIAVDLRRRLRKRTGS